jgi:predicted dehydrogenase
MTYLLLGVIGYGGVATQHVKALAAVPEVRVAAVLGPDSGRAAALAAEVGGIGTSQVETFLGTVDAAVIASPSSLHVEQASTLLRQRCAALIELPAAPSATEAAALASLATSTGTLVAAAHTSRWLPAIAAVGEAIGSGRLGEIRSVEVTRRVGRRDRQWRDDPLVHHGQHAIDVLRAWFGDVEAIAAVRASDRPAVTFDLRLPTGATATIDIEHDADADMQTIRVTGAASAVCTDGFGRITEGRDLLAEPVADIAPDDAYVAAIRAQDHAFVNAVRGGGSYAPFAETVRNLHVVDAIERLARNGS